MIDENKVLKMFSIVEPSIDLEIDDVRVTTDDYTFKVTEVAYYKDGHRCWGYSLEEILFIYMTRDWDES